MICKYCGENLTSIKHGDTVQMFDIGFPQYVRYTVLYCEKCQKYFYRVHRTENVETI